MKSILFLLMTGLSALNLCAQSTTPSSSAKPSWVLMMDDTNVNYYEAVKAFDSYWADKELPLEENELFQSSEEEKQSNEFISEKKNEHKGSGQTLAFEYKRFKHWQITVLPFVKEDGSIMNADERIEQWKLQRSNRK